MTNMKNVIAVAVVLVGLAGCYASHEADVGSTSAPACGVGGETEADAVDVGAVSAGESTTWDADGSGWVAVDVTDATSSHVLEVSGDVVDVTVTCPGGGVYECSGPGWRVIPAIDYPGLPRFTMPACRYVSGGRLPAPTTINAMCFDASGEGTPARVYLRAGSGACGAATITAVGGA